MNLQKLANSAARKAGYGKATHIVYGPVAAPTVTNHVSYGYRKNTTGEYVSNAYRNNFGWKNTYYQAAQTTVMLPCNWGSA